MVVQTQTSSPQSNSSLSPDNGAVLESHVPKIRKPYTITKQRERWTEEEHKKFLEALKEHGRAWRKIEEYVGTKTAVQIRSHAQKFFSKVVRESSVTNTTSNEPIEIPPPRPKRKPMHPYPRKISPQLTKDSPMEDQPYSSLSEQDNNNHHLSPTSVLSANVSDPSGSGDSTTPNGSSSPVCSASGVDQSGFSPCEDTTLSPCEDTTRQHDVLLSESAAKEFVSVKLELFPNIDTFEKQGQNGAKTLKLFGKDVLVHKSQEDLKPLDISLATCGNSWEEFETDIDDKDGNSSPIEKPTPLPWWEFFKGMPIPLRTVLEDTQEKETTNPEGSSACSNSVLLSNEVGSVDKSWDTETQSTRSISEEPNHEKRTNFINIGTKGFVPYKRCFSERGMITNSSSITNDEKPGQRMRLCL